MTYIQSQAKAKQQGRSSSPQPLIQEQNAQVAHEHTAVHGTITPGRYTHGGRALHGEMNSTQGLLRAVMDTNGAEALG